MRELGASQRIRHIFLHERANVSTFAASRLLGWTKKHFDDAVTAGALELLETRIGKRVPREELIAVALELWPAETIEAALGEEASRVLPSALRLAELRARIPKYQVAMLKHLARESGTTISAVLARELEDVACARSEELSTSIPGFAEALSWPELPNHWLA